MNEIITLPDTALLMKMDGWAKDPINDHRYSAVRFHFLLRGPFQLDEPVRKGEVIGASTPLRGVSEKQIFTTEYEVTTLQVNELVKQALRESETIQGLEAALSASLGSDLLGKITSQVKASATRRLLDSFTDTFKVSVSDTHREKNSVTREYLIDPTQFERDATLVFVKAYKAFAYKLYLQFIDTLVVAYTGTPLSLKLKRTKLPVVTNAKHPNILRLGLALSSIRYWKEIPQSSLLVEEKNYKNEVEDPDEIRIEPLVDAKRYPVASMPPRPTLYDLAEQVFPAKIWK
jgi:hypothetical protein